MRALLFGAIAAVAIVGTACGGSTTCVTGRTESCACVGGAVGAQTCLADGTFGTCVCPLPDVDAGHAMDAGDDIDSGASDLGVPSDGGRPDASAPDGGAIHGHAVLLGNLMRNADDAFDTIFANAIFLSERGGSNLRVLEYDEYSAVTGGSPHAEAVMDAAATARGRTLTRTMLASASALPAALPTTDVLFVPLQFADRATMTTVAGFWHDPLLAFLHDGGVIVVLSGDASVSGDSGEQWRILDAADLFTIPSGGGSLGGGTVTIEIVAATDPIAASVVTPFPTDGREASCFSGSAHGVVVARTVDAMLCPVVRHLVL